MTLFEAMKKANNKSIVIQNFDGTQYFVIDGVLYNTSLEKVHTIYNPDLEWEIVNKELVKFGEAIKALGQGKVVKSAHTNAFYKIIDDTLYDVSPDTLLSQCNFSYMEMSSKWYI